MASTKVRSLWLFGICMLNLLTLSVADAATITVNSLADPGAPGICVLRDAITAANGQKRVNGCRAGSGNDTINFSVSGTIKLGPFDDLPEITDHQLIVNGPITVSDEDMFSFAWFVGSSATVKLNKVSIDGIFGGECTAIDNQGSLTVANNTFQEAEHAVCNSGILTVTNSTFTENTGNIEGPGAILNDFGGTLTVINSTFSQNGDTAIINEGTATVAASTFSDNHGNRGAGAIDNDGTLAVINSTFSGNASVAFAGAIDNFDGTLTVISSTFSGNSAGNGNGVVTNPGADIDNFSGSASLKNTILAGSGDLASGNPISNCSGTITDDGYNLSDDDSCNFTATGSLNNTNPGLSSAGLAINGGPTETIALAGNSLAIDAIPLADCTDQNGKRLKTDQRGFPRPDAEEDVCDIGAFETQDNGACSQNQQDNNNCLRLGFMLRQLLRKAQDGG